MPDTLHYTAWRIPTEAESSKFDVHFANFREDAGKNANLYATSAANRDALFATVPNGTQVTSTTDGTQWVKVDTGIDPSGWVTVYSDTGWIDLAGATMGADWVDINSKYKIKNGDVHLYWECSYDGESAVATANNIPDTVIMTLPAEITPSVNAGSRFFVSASGAISGRFMIKSTGELVATHAFLDGGTWPISNQYYGDTSWEVTI